MTSVPAVRGARSTQPTAATRETILLATVTALRRHAFHELDFLALSQDSAIPVEALHREFPDWSELVIAVLERWTTERMRPLGPASATMTATDLLRWMVVSNRRDPVLVHLFIVASASTSAVPEHPLAVYIRRRTAVFRARIAALLQADVARGDAPATLDPEEAAGDLMQLFDGVQVQSLLRPELDVVSALARGVEAIRSGWERAGSGTNSAAASD
jgi:AcrR family transcriptional regulator